MLGMKLCLKVKWEVFISTFYRAEVHSSEIRAVRSGSGGCGEGICWWWVAGDLGNLTTTRKAEV